MRCTPSCAVPTPYRELTLAEFEQVVQMLADGFSTRRGRRGAYLHLDAVNRVLRARRGARLAAVTNAGVIPDQFDYDVVLLPEEHRVGTLNEDFAFESLAGDVFQLGNTSYRIVKVETGKVMVEDARGQPPSMPFWLGESLGRTDELSHAVSRLSALADARLEDGVQACERWLRDEQHLPAAAAQQLALYLGASKAALGRLPTGDRIVLERFFDEVGDSHLVIHSPHGSRINKAWGLALRKRMCRKFNFELQASALEDSIVLSLGPTHSFALDEVRHYLKSTGARDLLVQALLDAPMFGTRFRWNATASLAVRRMNAGRKVPPQFQRTDAEDLITVVFPDSQACGENMVGEREIPDHPLVAQTLHDCLHETMDADGFVRLLQRIESGAVDIVARDLASPSPLSHAILNARPYAFLDGGAAEERRTKTVAAKALMDLQTAHDIGRLDPAVIAQVRADAWPEIQSADELHDALCVHGFLAAGEVDLPAFVEALAQQRRATRLTLADGRSLFVAAERLHEVLAVHPAASLAPSITAVHRQGLDRDAALRELLRGRLDLLGPVTAAALAEPLGLQAGDVMAALLQLEAEGGVMRGAFTATGAEEWCDRRLLARMHRLTRDKHRADIQPVPPAQLMRFLFRWHQLASDADDERREGESGLADALRQLEGHAAPASAWEDELLSARVSDYTPAMLDKLCAVGRVVWWRPTDSDRGAAQRPDPRHADRARRTRRAAALAAGRRRHRAGRAAAVEQGACGAASPARARRQLLRDLQRDAGLLGEPTEQALAELVAQGLVTCDSFAGLRALVMPADKRHKLRRRRPGHDPIDDAGRWALTHRIRAAVDVPGALAEPHVDHIARVLLRRYGVVFRKLLEREPGLPPWRELHYVYRRLEARGEVRGGRFVSGFSGEQFALPEAAAALRKVARHPGRERVSISALDPLNLVGIVTPGEKIARLAGNRVLFEGGVPIAVHAGGEVRYLAFLDERAQWTAKNLLIRKQRPGSFVDVSGVAQ